MKRLARLLLISIFLFAVSCKKTTSSNAVGGGKGGNVTLTVVPEHGGVFIDSCIVYIKYGTENAPSNGIYDDSTICVLADTTPVATFTNLTKGVYHIYGSGYHATYSPPYVKGGRNCTITSDTGTVNVYLPLYTYTY